MKNSSIIVLGLALACSVATSAMAAQDRLSAERGSLQRQWDRIQPQSQVLHAEQDDVAVGVPRLWAPGVRP